MLKGKNIVITGCSRGIGRVLMWECMRNGANVFACMRTDASVHAPDFLGGVEKENCGGSLIPFFFDLADEQSVKAGAAEILAHKVPIHGIVNNAGTAGAKSLFLMTSIKDIRETFEVNFFGPFFLTQYLLKNMVRQRSGAVVNVSSVAAIDGVPGQFAYVSSKAAVVGATKKLAQEMETYGIRVNAVAPGVVQTDMMLQMEEKLLNETISRTSLKRTGLPEEVAGAVIYLLSDRCGNVTGQTFRVDGGIYT